MFKTRVIGREGDPIKGPTSKPENGNPPPENGNPPPENGNPPPEQWKVQFDYGTSAHPALLALLKGHRGHRWHRGVRDVAWSGTRVGGVWATVRTLVGTRVWGPGLLASNPFP